jgi:hypothetical protein
VVRQGTGLRGRRVVRPAGLNDVPQAEEPLWFGFIDLSAVLQLLARCLARDLPCLQISLFGEPYAELVWTGLAGSLGGMLVRPDFPRQCT